MDFYSPQTDKFLVFSRIRIHPNTFLMKHDANNFYSDVLFHEHTFRKIIIRARQTYEELLVLLFE